MLQLGNSAQRVAAWCPAESHLYLDCCVGLRLLSCPGSSCQQWVIHEGVGAGPSAGIRGRSARGLWSSSLWCERAPWMGAGPAQERKSLASSLSRTVLPEEEGWRGYLMCHCSMRSVLLINSRFSAARGPSYLCFSLILSLISIWLSLCNATWSYSLVGCFVSPIFPSIISVILRAATLQNQDGVAEGAVALITYLFV